MSKTLKKIYRINSGFFYRLLLCVSVMGIFGYFLHDLILYIDADDMEMTVFPLGTMMVFMIMAFGAILIGASTAANFNLVVALGGSRKEYFAYMLIGRIITFSLLELFAFGEFMLECWKFEKYYYPKYSLELDISKVFTIPAIIMVILLATATSIILPTVMQYFGSKAWMVIMILYFGVILGFTRIEHIVEMVGPNVMELIAKNGVFVYGFVVVLMLAIIGVSGFLNSKTDVKI